MSYKSGYYLNWFAVLVCLFSMVSATLDPSCGSLQRFLCYAFGVWALWLGGKNWHEFSKLTDEEWKNK